MNGRRIGSSREALDRFEQQTAWPMLVLSLAIVPLLVIPLIWDLSPSTEATLFAIDLFLWALFALEYGIRLFLAPHKGRFIRSNLVDLIVVLLPLLRPLRVLRSARMLRLLRLARVAVVFVRALDAIKDVLTRHKLHYTLLVAIVLTLGVGTLVAELERTAPEGNIESIPEGLWWAVTTVTTVGYGDTFPTTPAGRAFAVILMLVGISLFGLLTANLASFLVRRDEEPEQATGDQEIIQRLDRIERLLDRETGRRE